MEARLIHGYVWRQLLDSIKDLVVEANFMCDGDGIHMQAMDASHVSMVVLNLRAQGFSSYNVTTNRTLGISMDSLNKVFKCMGKSDCVTLIADDDAPDELRWKFAALNAKRLAEFTMKLMDIDSETLGIPKEDYACQVRMPGGELQKILTNLTSLGDTVKITVTKDAVRFGIVGESTEGDIVCRRTEAEDQDADLDVENETDQEKTDIQIDGSYEELTQTFALRYLNYFLKGGMSAGLGKTVFLKMSPDVPLLCEYVLADEMGTLQFYLAPKIADGEAADDDSKEKE